MAEDQKKQAPDKPRAMSPEEAAKHNQGDDPKTYQKADKLASEAGENKG